MGFIKSFFNRGERPVAEDATKTEGEKYSITPHTGVMDGDVSSLNPGQPKRYITLSAATGYPIDAVYDFVLHDLEEEGYNDALVSSDLTYCQQKERILRNKLDLLFERVTLNYREKMRKLETQKQLANDALLHSAVASLSASYATLQEHMDKLAEMQKKAKNGDETFLNMISSYRRGFLKGVTATCDHLVNSNLGTINLMKHEEIL